MPDHASRLLQHLSLSLSVGGARGYARGYESLGWQGRALSVKSVSVLRAAQTFGIARENVYSANLV